jgi:quercetin dioxygenase-like cupin family protein
MITEAKTDFLTDHLQNNAVVFSPGQGTILSLGNGNITLKVTSDITNDQLGIYEITLGAGMVGAQLHYHRFTDETFIVTKGILSIQLSDREAEATEGSVVYVPRFTPHGFSNKSDKEVKLFLLFNPGQKREGFFYGMKEVLSQNPIDPGHFLKLYNKYDSVPVDPKNSLPKL